MRLQHDLHLAYCTNIHRGENWAETFAGLKAHTLRVKAAVCPDAPYAIGLRLSAVAAEELSEPGTLQAFQDWLEEHQCYVFTVNGFPYGKFHGGKVKEQVYRPDWTTRERVNYTKKLFDLLARLVPDGVAASVSTSPASFKDFGIEEADRQLMRKHYREVGLYIAEVSERTGRDLHLGIEPEPLCTLETSEETVAFLLETFADFPDDESVLRRRLGINYDCCHLAVEFEEASEALGRIEKAGIRMSKIHLSSALRLKPTTALLDQLRAFQEDIYLHQTIVRQADGTLHRFSDLGPALDWAATSDDPGEEWRVHFHIPLHHDPTEGLLSTADQMEATLDWLGQQPSRCQHLEMETYTWEVLPPELRQGEVVDQLVKEYDWCLNQLKLRELA
ncbi:MAG: metabolite traffic protein EboE [Verrucomicrobiaceae bacterium]|nr:metabolite traffic protein EboE [Verrucomicrobiaceae bacterium]